MKALVSNYGEPTTSNSGASEEPGANVYVYLDHCCREMRGKPGLDVEASYIWNCTHFLALVPSLLNSRNVLIGKVSFAKFGRCQAECFVAHMAGTSLKI